MPKEIKLYGRVGRYESFSHYALSAALKDAQGEEVHIRVHSPGGDVFEGWAIFNLLQQAARNGSRIKFYIDGIAASMASFIIQAGHEIHAAENSMLMLHAPSGTAWGTWKKLKEGADLLKKVQDLMAKEYSRRSGQDDDTVAKWLDGDNWMTPQEAMKAGLIDGIIPSVATRKMDPTLAPEQAYEAYAACMPEASGQAPQQIKPMKAVFAHLGLAEDATEATALNKIRETEAALEKARKDLADLKQQSAADKAAALIDGAVASNKIAPGDKEKYVKLATADYETTKDLVEALNPLQSVTSQIEANQGGDENLSAAWDEAHKKGTLEQIKANKPERYAAMHQARWGNR